MKKILTVLLTLMLCTSMVAFKQNEVSAASASSTGSSTVSVGQTFAVTFRLANTPTVTGGAIEIEHSDSLTLKSGTFSMSDIAMNSVLVADKRGAFTLNNPAAINGDLCTLVFVANKVDNNAYAKVTINCNNDDEPVVENVTHTRNIKIICATHSYGEWKVDKEATCTESGSQSRTCSVCGTIETEKIAPLGHDIQSAVTTKEATCTEEGEETGHCIRCDQDVVQKIPAIGHIYGSWEVLKESTCTERGTAIHYCMVCNESETKLLDLAEHVLGDDAEIIQEATLYQKGLIRGTCVNCGQLVEMQTSCTHADVETGAVITCEEGVFEEGTEIEIEKYSVESTRYAEAKEIMVGLEGNIELYSVIAVKDGERVQPNGTVEVTFKIPDGFSDKVIIVYVDENGNYEVISSKTDVENRTVTAYLEHFSDYAIYDLMVSKTGDVSSAWMYALIAETCVFVAILSYLVIKGKKKK